MAGKCLLSFVCFVTSMWTVIFGLPEPKMVFVTDSSEVFTNWFTIAVPHQNTSANITLQIVDVSNCSPLALQRILCEQIEDGAVLIAIDVSCDKLNLLVPFLDNVGIPAINLRLGPCFVVETGSTMGLSFVEQEPDYSIVLADVVDMLHWDQFIVVYDEHYVPFLDNINSMLTDLNITTQIVKIVQLKQDVAGLLHYIQQQKGVISKFMLACSLPCLLEIFDQANQYEKINDVQGLFTFHSQWFIIGHSYTVLQTIEAEVKELDHVTWLIKQEVTSSKQEMIQDIFSQLLSTVAIHADGLLEGINGSSSCKSAVNSTALIYGSLQDFVSREVCLNCTDYSLLSAFYKQGRERKFVKTGEWTRTQYIPHGPVMPNLQYGFNGKHFLIATNIWDPFVLESENTTSGFDGLCLFLLKELAINLNFTYDLTLPKDGQWGVKINGSWTGLVGIIQKKAVDMVVAPLATSVSRESAMDFTEAFFLEYQSVLVRYKDPEGEKWKLYLEPFEWESWISFLAAIPLGALAIWLVTRLTPYYKCHGPDAEAKANQGLGKLDNAMLFSFGSFFQQGSIWIPESQSGRFIVGFWWMYCIVVMATYSGNLIAYLTVTKTELPFNSLDDMLAQDKFKFGTMAGTLQHESLMKARTGQAKVMWDSIQEFQSEDMSVLSGDHQNHINKVINENYAYIQDMTSFELETSKRCDIGIIAESFQPMEYAIGLQNNSYYEKMVSLEIIKIKETGLVRKWKVEIWPRQSFCSTGTWTNAKAVSLTDVQGAYYAMGILLGLSCIILLTETVIYLGTARTMTGNHSGGYNNSHVIQMNSVQHSGTTDTVSSNGFTSVQENGGHGLEYASMFNSNSETHLATAY